MSSGCGDVLSLADLQTAKKHQLFEAEVITGKQGGVAGGVDIDYATNQVTGQSQKTLPAVLRDAGFRPASFSFDTGGTLSATDTDKAVLWPAPGGDGQYYVWRGTYPKTIPASSTPNTTGGISSTAWQPIGDSTLKPLVEVISNVVGTDDYAPFPGTGATVTDGADYLYNDVLYTLVGDSGTVSSVSGNVVTTSGGTAYLLDKRWEINDLRAWGVKDGDNADVAFKNAATFLCRRPGTITRSLNVPPIGISFTSVELRDMSNFNIHFDGTYILATATTAKTAMISVVNATFFTITGTPLIEATTNNYTYAVEFKGGLPSLIAPLTGLLSNVYSDTIRVRNFPCAVRVGDGSDLQISEIQLNLQTNRCNCCAEVNGSQAIATINGSLLCEPQAAFTYTKAVFHCIGGIAYQTAGEAVSSVDNDGVIVQLRQVSSSMYGNPFGSAKITGTHVECAGLLMAVDNGTGIVGASDSKYSTVSFSNCQGSMLNGASELVAIRVDPYEGTFAVDSTCNFYTSATRTKKIVYSTSPSFNFEVSPRAFRKGFGTLAAEIGSGNVNWIHGLQPIIRMAVNAVTIPASGTAVLGFSAREATGDYAFYYGDTSSGGIVTVHKFDSLVVSISVPASAALTIRLKINGVEQFSCQNSGTVTLPRELVPVGTTITFEATNGTGSSVTTASSARIVVSGSNRD